MTERDRAARRRLVWLLLRRGYLGAEALHSDGLPALRSPTGATAPTRDAAVADTRRPTTGPSPAEA